MDEIIKTPKRIALYLRVSTTDQTEKYGLDLQRASIMSMIDSRSKTDQPFIFAGEKYVYVDDISGAVPIAERPAFARLMEDIILAPEGAKPFDIVAVYKIDRFARKLSILFDVTGFLDRNNIQFISVNESIDTSTAYGRAMLGFMGVCAELERDTIKDRTFAGRISAVTQGVHMGTSAKYGYIKDESKHLKICEEEANVVRLVFDLFVVQKKSVYEIADHLKSRKYLIPEASAIKHLKHSGSGKAKGSQYNWHPENIRRMLADEIYIGRAYYGRTKGKKKVEKKDWICYPVEPIIDILTFEKASRLLGESKHQKKETKSKHTYLLSGLLRCDNCKTNHKLKYFTGTSKELSSKKRVYYYVCKGKSKIYNEDPCQTLPLSADAIEDYVINLCLNLLSNPIHTFKYQQSLNSTKVEIKHLNVDEIQTRKLLEDVPVRKERLRQQHELGVIDYSRLVKEVESLNESELHLKQHLEEVRSQLALNTLNEGYLKTFGLFNEKYKDVIKNIRKDRQELYNLIHILVDRIIVYSRPVEDKDRIAGRKKGNQMIADRIHIKFKLPQEMLNELGSPTEKAPIKDASSSQKDDGGAR